MDVLLWLFAAVVVATLAVAAVRRSQQRRFEQEEAELAPVRQLVFEDVTVLGEELQQLDVDLAGRSLDDGERDDYQRALDTYETAKRAADRLTAKDDVKHVTEILDDGRYAMACVRARVAGDALPTRRPPCFFDPRHGLSVEDVLWAPPGGAERDVPACTLDAERVRAGAEPDTRTVLVGSQQVPYWQGGRAYEPYAAGYFAAFAPMQWMFVGMLFSGAFTSPAAAWDGGDGSGYDGSGYDGSGYDGSGYDGSDGGGADAAGASDAGGDDWWRGGGDAGAGGDGGWSGGDWSGGGGDWGGGFDGGF